MNTFNEMTDAGIPGPSVAPVIVEGIYRFRADRQDKSKPVQEPISYSVTLPAPADVPASVLHTALARLVVDYVTATIREAKGWPSGFEPTLEAAHTWASASATRTREVTKETLAAFGAFYATIAPVLPFEEPVTQGAANGLRGLLEGRLAKVAGNVVIARRIVSRIEEFMLLVTDAEDYGDAALEPHAATIEWILKKCGEIVEAQITSDML